MQITTNGDVAYEELAIPHNHEPIWHQLDSLKLSVGDAILYFIQYFAYQSMLLCSWPDLGIIDRGDPPWYLMCVSACVFRIDNIYDDNPTLFSNHKAM